MSSFIYIPENLEFFEIEDAFDRINTFLYFGCFIIYFEIGALAIYGISVLVHIVLEKVFKFDERRIEKVPNSQLE